MDAITIGSRVEMMVDDALIDSAEGLEFRLNRPAPRGMAIVTDRPWEQAGSFAYVSVFRWKGLFHMYYRASATKTMRDTDEEQYLCYARSVDGIRWEKPSLGLYEWNGSRDNNILMGGPMCHNFTPVLDDNPDCPAQERIKALAGYGDEGLWVFISEDGLHFRKKYDHPALTGYLFDSQNVLFYDAARGVYRIYARYVQALPDGETADGDTAVRAIFSSESKDCEHWSEPAHNVYRGGLRSEHLYTNATTPCPGAGHILLSFPMRFAAHRSRGLICQSEGVSDSVFMSSRDGVHWDRRHMDSFIAGENDERSWTQRCNMTARGVLETGGEFSVYASKRYAWPDAGIARYSLRKFGFSALYAGDRPGELVSRPLIFSGERLRVNFSTAAVGSLKAGLYDAETGRAIEGFSLDDCREAFGDALDEELVFRGGLLSACAGRPVVMRVRMRLCSLFSFRFE